MRVASKSAASVLQWKGIVRLTANGNIVSPSWASIAKFVLVGPGGCGAPQAVSYIASATAPTSGSNTRIVGPAGSNVDIIALAAPSATYNATSPSGFQPGSNGGVPYQRTADTPDGIWIPELGIYLASGGVGAPNTYAGAVPIGSPGSAGKGGGGTPGSDGMANTGGGGGGKIGTESGYVAGSGAPGGQVVQIGPMAVAAGDVFAGTIGQCGTPQIIYNSTPSEISRGTLGGSGVIYALFG